MPRQERKKSESKIYHIMLRGVNQQQILQDKEDNQKFIEVLKVCKAISEFKLYAYCLMGNHIHLLIKEEKEPLEQIFKRIGSRYVYWYNVKYQRVGHLFQDRFKSEPVNDEKYFLTVLRYIHQNPVKAGIVKTCGEYKFSSYLDYINYNSFIDYDFVYELLSADEFEKFNNQKNDDLCLELKEQVSIRLTDEDAKQIIEKKTGCKTVEEFQRLQLNKQKMALIYFREKGMSIRQISRLTGISKGKIERLS